MSPFHRSVGPPFTSHRTVAHLVVFDAPTHAFRNDPHMPEAIEANHMMADFFVKHLGQ
ncbi:MAG TPA: hypothetical protein VME23_12720 [Terracidiphilus sp.]|nr:hypothetical protein [Terracidiphilus sp.]